MRACSPSRVMYWSRIHRLIHIGADGAGSGAVQGMARQALRLVERKAGANGIACGQRRIDIEHGPALQWRDLARQSLHLIRPLLAADLRHGRASPDDIERPGALGLAGKHRPVRIVGLDRKPGHRLGRVGIGDKLQRQLRGESVHRNRLDHTIRRRIERRQQRGHGHRDIIHRLAVGDIVRNRHMGHIRPLQKLVPAKVVGLAADDNVKHRLRRSAPGHQ